jgi:hypothetical protein
MSDAIHGERLLVPALVAVLVLVACLLTWAVVGVSEKRDAAGRSESLVETKVVEYPSLGSPGCASSWSFAYDPVYIEPSAPHRKLNGLMYRGVRELRGLVFTDHHVPLVAGQEVKVAWHMAGIGQVRITVTGPDGRNVPLAWGPDFRGFDPVTTNEWGTGFIFDQPGCWYISLRRYDTTANVWIQVATRPSS